MRSPGAFFRRWFGRQTSLPEVNSVALMADPLSHSTDPPGEALQEEPLEDLDLPRVMPIEESIDLHTFSPKETASVVEEYLIEAQRRGFREVRIVHGRGKGVQRRIIQRLLERHPLVDGFSDAPPARGGWGATLAWLKPLALQPEVLTPEVLKPVALQPEVLTPEVLQPEVLTPEVLTPEVRVMKVSQDSPGGEGPQGDDEKERTS